MVRYLYRELNTSDRDNGWVEELEFFSEMIESKNWKFFQEAETYKELVEFSKRREGYYFVLHKRCGSVAYLEEDRV